MSIVESQGGLGKYIVVYVCMLVISVIELVIAYSHSGGSGLLVSLLLLAIIGALLGVLYFMGLAAERRTLIVCVAVFTLFVLATINYGWTDSFRLLLGVPYSR